MGSCFCCQSNGHCDSAEETSLLQNDSKAAAVGPAETPVVGTCGPGIEEDISKEELNKGAETEPYSAQENGTLKKNSLQTEAPSSKSPHHQSNKDNAQDVDVKARVADTEIAGRQQSTLTPQHMGRADAGWEVSKTTPEEEKPAEDKNLNETAVCTKAPSLIETQPKQKHIIMDSINNNSEDAGGSGQVTLDKSMDEPTTDATAEWEGPATHVCQVLPVTEIKEEVTNAEMPSSVDKGDPENRSSLVCVEAKPDETQSHEVPVFSLGSESTPDHSSVPEPDTTSTADVCKSPEQVEKCDSECTKDTTTEESQKDIQPEEQVKEKDDVHGENIEDTLEKAAEGAPEGAPQGAPECAPECAPEGASEGASEGVPEVEEAILAKEVQLVESSSAKAEVDAGENAVATKERDIEDDLENSEEDLYRGAEELSASLTTTSGAPSLSETFLIVEDRCSLAPAVNILSYSEREWRGNTTKSALIRKGYKEMTQRFSSLRRVRGDNYCALRATLYQILSNTSRMPEWLQEESITMLPKDLEAREGLISQWIFPGECLLQGDRDATQQLTGYMELLRNKWQAAVDCVSPAERQQMCEQLFQGGEEELGMLEALKLLMLARAVELHVCMQRGEDMPLFCWLLFARDSSDCPRAFLNNHLSHVGLSAGLEQVEMFLLGYALQCTIQVYRLYKADTEEFVTFYPDDHKDDWPCVCLVTEDDRHYNVPVLEAADLPQELKSS